MKESYKDKMHRIINTLESHGWKEHWPPSRTRWYYKRGKKTLAVNWETATVELYDWARV